MLGEVVALAVVGKLGQLGPTFQLGVVGKAEGRPLHKVEVQGGVVELDRNDSRALAIALVFAKAHHHIGIARAACGAEGAPILALGGVVDCERPVALGGEREELLGSVAAHSGTYREGCATGGVVGVLKPLELATHSHKHYCYGGQIFHCFVSHTHLLCVCRPIRRGLLGLKFTSFS